LSSIKRFHFVIGDIDNESISIMITKELIRGLI